VKKTVIIYRHTYVEDRNAKDPLKMEPFGMALVYELFQALKKANLNAESFWAANWHTAVTRHFETATALAWLYGYQGNIKNIIYDDENVPPGKYLAELSDPLYQAAQKIDPPAFVPGSKKRWNDKYGFFEQVMTTLPHADEAKTISLCLSQPDIKKILSRAGAQIYEADIGLCSAYVIECDVENPFDRRYIGDVPMARDDDIFRGVFANNCKFYEDLNAKYSEFRGGGR